MSLHELGDNAHFFTGGDHNCTFSGHLDRENCSVTDDIGREELLIMTNELNLEDIWRRRNPETFDYSWQRGDKKI